MFCFEYNHVKRLVKCRVWKYLYMKTILSVTMCVWVCLSLSECVGASSYECGRDADC